MIHGQVYFLFILCVRFLFRGSTQKSALRIIGGRDASPGEFPFAVRPESHNKFTIYYGNHAGKTVTKISCTCSAAALTPRWMLTARHCAPTTIFSATKNYTNFIVEFKFMIRYGNPHVKPSENDKLAAVLNSKKPERESINTHDDIALLYTEPIAIDRYAKISAIDYTSLYGHEVTCLGFGLMRVSPGVNNFDYTSELDKPLQVMEKAMLRSCDGDRNDMENMKICVVPECGKDQTPFLGDSGAPVLHTSGVIGVIIAGGYFIETNESRKRVFKPNIAIITPVSLYLDWIHSHITNDVEEKI